VAAKEWAEFRIFVTFSTIEQGRSLEPLVNDIFKILFGPST
jgi:hypothetical protein